MNEILTLNGVRCFEKDGVAYLNLEAVARGLGFTQTQQKGGVEYTSIRWERVEQYLAELGFPHKWGKDDYIPENIFYRLAMKAKNETAEKFQALVADEIIPSIRKHGAYMTQETLQAAIMNPDYLLQIVTALKDETDKRKALEITNSRLVVENQIMQPKAEYFDELVDRNLLTNFRDTAKELGVPPKTFTKFLLDHKYLYRDKLGKLMPYEQKNKGLFEVKECINDKSGWKGTQTLVTPKGRETFRLLLDGCQK